MGTIEFFWDQKKGFATNTKIFAEKLALYHHIVKKNFFKVANFRHYVTTLALSLRPKQ
jgi:hypothetical protein